MEFDQAFVLLHAAPKEALAAWTKRLEALPAGPHKTAGITAFFKTLAEIDTRTAVDLALSMKPNQARWNAIGAVTNGTPAVNLPEIGRLYTALKEEKIGLYDLVLNWSRIDPVATAEFVSGYGGEVRNEELTPLMENWAALDPAAARDWLAKAEPGRRDERVYAGFYSGWLEHDRIAALKDLTIHAEDPTFKKAVEAVSKDLFKLSQDEARTFILTLPPNGQETAVSCITSDVTGVYLSGGPDLQVDEVAKWLVTLPETLWHDQLGGVLSQWANGNKAKRDEWLSQLAPATQDAALAACCRAFDSYNPTENIRAGLRIRDRELREQTLSNVFRDMEADARRQALTHAQLTAAESQELANILKRL